MDLHAVIYLRTQGLAPLNTKRVTSVMNLLFIFVSNVINLIQHYHISKKKKKINTE